MEKPRIEVFRNVSVLLNSLATFLIKLGNKAIDEKGEFTFVLSGGNSPEKLYELLASDTYRNEIDWNKVSFFLGDERYVSSTSPDSNARMVRNTLFCPLEISENNIHVIDTTLEPLDAAQAYFEVVKSHFRDRPIQFDLILLGLGDDVHTASLFPFTTILLDNQPGVAAVFVEKLNSYRITLNAPLINQSDHIVFLVYGEDKADAVRHVMEGDRNIEKYPAQLIHPHHGTVYWFLDETATFNCNNC